MAVARALLVTSGALVLAACAAPPPEPAATAAPLRVCPTSPLIEGVDVADYQGAIDWPTFAASSGKEFAIARVSDGLHMDTRFDTYWPAMQAAGVIRGAYELYRPTQSIDSQIALFRAHVASLGPGDLPPILDVEVNDGASAATMVAGMHTWVDAMRAAYGREPMIYSSNRVWTTMVGSSPDFASLPFWVANYPTSCTYTMGFCPTIPDPWPSWLMWQYCDHGTIAGIPDTTPDLDVFQGTHDELLALAGMTAATDAGTPPTDAGAGADGAAETDAGAGTDAAAGTDAGTSDASTTTDGGGRPVARGGCCGVAGCASSRGLALTAAVAGLALARRRRRQSQ